MKKLLALVSFQLVFICCFAQPMLQKGQRDSLLKSMLAVGKVFGVLSDSLTQKPVEFASVAVVRVKDSVAVAGMLTDQKGKFQIEEVPYGRFTLQVKFIGYKDFKSAPFMIIPNQTEKDFGQVNFSPTATRLKEVTIAADKDDFINYIDRKVYNVDKNIVNTGGTATEVLSNIPSVSVDIDGKVSLRGNTNVTVLIDGKPSGLTGASRQAVLQQIPASSIERIEVITNPSAKYDADGMGGIINIITKKDKMKGMNGSVSIGLGTNDKFNGSINANYRTSHFNIYGNYTYRHETRAVSGTSTRKNFFSDTTNYSLSENHGSNSSNTNNGKLGADFYLDNYNTLGVAGSFNVRDENHPGQNVYEFQNSELVTVNSFTRDNEETENSKSNDLNLDYRRTFKNSKTELTASGTYSASKRDGFNEYKNYFSVGGDPSIQQNNTNGKFNVLTVQSDFTLPKSTWKFEAGVKSTTRNNDNTVDASRYNYSTAEFDEDTKYSDNYLYREQINAGYAIFSSAIKNLDYQVGLRSEQSLIHGDSKTTNISFDNDYIDFFPSGFLKYTLKEKNEFQLSYSRRVNRPENRSLNPFVDYGDSLNIRVGNPYLKPEYINSYEFSYNTSWKDKAVSLSTTLFYRRTDNMITRYRTLDTSTSVSVMTFRNFNSSDNYGAEIILRTVIGRIGSIMVSSYIAQTHINATNVESELQNDALNWRAMMTANLRLSTSTAFQLTGNYMAPVVQPQGSFKGMSGVDAGLKHDIWKGKASLSANVTDIFNNRKMIAHSTGEGFVIDSERSRESRVAMFTFQYRFGNGENNPFSRKKNQRNQQQDNLNQNQGPDDF